MKKYLWTGVLILLVCAGGICLPSLLLGWQDEKRIGRSEAEDAQEVLLTTHTELTLTEKLNLMRKGTMNSIALENGKNYKYNTIEAKMREEIQKLEELDILDLQGQKLNFSGAEMQFCIDTDGEIQSLMLWVIEAVTEQYSLTIVLDDETGKILALGQEGWADMKAYTDKGAASEEVAESMTDVDRAVKEADDGTGQPNLEASDLETIAENWAAYLGCILTETSWYPKINLPEEFSREAEALIKEKGLSEEEAYYEVYEALGITRDELDRRLYAVYQDNQGTATYEIVFWNFALSVSPVPSA